MLWAVFCSPRNMHPLLYIIVHTSNWRKRSSPFLLKGTVLKIIRLLALYLISQSDILMILPNICWWLLFGCFCVGYIVSPPFCSSLSQEKSRWWIHQLDQAAVRVIASQPYRLFFKSSRPCENWCRFRQVWWPVPYVCICDKYLLVRRNGLVRQKSVWRLRKSWNVSWSLDTLFKVKFSQASWKCNLYFSDPYL